MFALLSRGECARQAPGVMPPRSHAESACRLLHFCKRPWVLAGPVRRRVEQRLRGSWCLLHGVWGFSHLLLGSVAGHIGGRGSQFCEGAVWLAVRRSARSACLKGRWGL